MGLKVVESRICSILSGLRKELRVAIYRPAEKSQEIRIGIRVYIAEVSLNNQFLENTILFQ